MIGESVKEKIKHLRLELENGQVIEHDGGMLNVSYNYRTAGNGSPKILQSWYEHVVTWHSAINPCNPKAPAVGLPNTIKADRETLRGKAWCSVHQAEPGDCFKLHNPSAFANALDAEMKIAAQDAERWRKNFAKPLMEPLPSKYIDFFADFNEGYGNGKH